MASRLWVRRSTSSARTAEVAGPVDDILRSAHRQSGATLEQVNHVAVLIRPCRGRKLKLTQGEGSRCRGCGRGWGSANGDRGNRIDAAAAGALLPGRGVAAADRGHA